MAYKTLHSFPLPDEADPLAVFSALHDQPYSLFFDSADRDHKLARYSFITFQPIETIEAKNGKILVTNPEQRLSFYGNPFEVVRERLEGWGLNQQHQPDLPPFQGGAAGYFGYDLARSIEKLPTLAAENPDIPDMAIGIYDQVVAFDHEKQKTWLLVLANTEEQAQVKHAHFLRLTKDKNIPAHIVENPVIWDCNGTPSDYESKVGKVIDYIYTGDIFQANISQKFEATLPRTFDPFAHYCTLRDVNAAPFAAYMNFGSLKLSSASPERFLLLKDRQVETRPIKGTRPRLNSEQEDAAMQQELLDSEKDQAENTMIVDLLRNDLSKVCEDHSIQVPELCALESFASVHHLVSTVTGTLRADHTPLDLLHACFPGGSITGAPKIRAMEIIEELEPQRRGPYCGSMGYISFSGAMDTNIMIRTLAFENKTVSFQVGGGIVVDSDPDAEHQETLDKAEALFRSFAPAVEKKRQTV